MCRALRQAVAEPLPVPAPRTEPAAVRVAGPCAAPARCHGRRATTAAGVAGRSSGRTAAGRTATGLWRRGGRCGRSRHLPPGGMVRGGGRPPASPGAAASARGPRLPSHAVDLSRDGSDVISDPAPVDPARRGPAAAVPRRQRTAHRPRTATGVAPGTAASRAAGRSGRAGAPGGRGSPRGGAHADRARVEYPGRAADACCGGGHVGGVRTVRTGRGGSPGGIPRRPGRRRRSWGPCR